MIKTDSLAIELKKALNYIDGNWAMQNNFYDQRSNFIYNANTVDEVIELSKNNNIDYVYALHRWYNFKTSIYCENVFVEFGAIKEKNYRNREIDIYIDEVPFDVKLTVYPKALYDHPYDLLTREGKNEMIKWMYRHQSQQQRKHLANRLFIICDGGSQYDNLCLKSDAEQLKKEIQQYINDVKTDGFNEISIFDDGIPYKVTSDIIYIK